MKLNRPLQRSILTTLREVNPRRLDRDGYLALKEQAEHADEFIGNVLYLEEHGLLHSGLGRGLNGFVENSAAMTITAKGLDFLEEDGGLRAMLHTVTIKIHDDSLDRLEAFLAHIEPDPERRQKYVDRLRALPADATRHLLLKLVDLGLENLGGALKLFQTILR